MSEKPNGNQTPNLKSSNESDACDNMLGGTTQAPPLIVASRAYVAPALVAANLLWFAVGWLRAGRSGAGREYLRGSNQLIVERTLLEQGALSASSLLESEWWRILAYAFVHIGVVHLLANAAMLAVLGSVSERILGRGRFVAIYAGSAIAGGAAAMALHPRINGGVALLSGASGALWGVMLSVVVWYLRVRKRLPHDMAREWRWKLGSTLLLNLLVNFAPGVSVVAHIGGGLAGVALALGADPRRARGKGISPTPLAGFVAVLILAAIGLFAAMRWSSEWKAIREPQVGLRLSVRGEFRERT